MALLPCPECGREISTRPARCPQCGAPGFFAGAIAGLVGFIGLAVADRFVDPAAIAWNRDWLPGALAAWRRAIVCSRCGAITDPAAVAAW